jgi:transposase
MQQRHPDRRIQVWFQDETRIGQQGCLTRQWGLRGLRLTVPRQTEYEWVYGVGAVCPQTGDALALMLPEINTAAMNLFLRELSAYAARDIHMVLVMDCAAWHRSKGLETYENITALYLPPYSPELNPIERVWSYLKSHYLSNRVYENYERILDEVSAAWNHFQGDVDLIKSLTSESWFLLQN